MDDKLANLEDIIKTLGKAKGLKIFFSLKEPKTWTELEKIADGDKNSVSRRTDELLKLGLIKVEYNPKERRPFYSLTPTGRRILELLEEIAKVYEEKVSLEEKELKWIEESLKKSEE